MLSQLGKEIDQHPFVLRLNDGAVDGFEKYVGSKRSLRFGWNSTYHPEETYIDCMSTRPVPIWSTALLMACDEKHLTGMLHGLAGGIGGGAINKATTGARALVMAMSNCAEVHAYGFFHITSDARRKLKFHYYGSGAKKPYEAHTRVHTTWNAEHDLWPQLAEPAPEMQEWGKMVIPGLTQITDCSPNASASVPQYLVRNHGDLPSAPKAPTTTKRVSAPNTQNLAKSPQREGGTEVVAGILRTGWASGFVAGALSVICIAMAVICHRRFSRGVGQKVTCMIGISVIAACTITLSFASQQKLTVFSAGIAV